MAVSREKFKTYGSVFDEKTILALQRLEGRGVFNELLSPISVGKESNVFSAETNNGVVCVKIYRLNTCDFHKMYKYISQDRRFNGVQKRRRAVVFAWCRREFRNLKVAHKLKVNVPKPIAFFENVLVMEYLGDKNGSFKLRESNFEVRKYSKIVLSDLQKLYQKCKLVHGDLSEFNILDFKNKPYIIYFSHGMKLDYPNVEEYLERDVKTIITFFNRRGCKLEFNHLIEEIKNG